MNETLKPCPFCGSVAELRSEGKHHFVACTDEEECGVEGHRARVYDYAIETWNYRTAAEQVRAPGVRKHRWEPIMDGTLCCQHCMVDFGSETSPICKEAPALTGASAVGEDDALKYATRLLVALMEKYYPDRHPDWKPLPDLYGVLTQIDNLTTGLVRASAVGEVEPVEAPFPSKDELIVSLLRQIREGNHPCTICGAASRCEACEEVNALDAAAPVQPGDGWQVISAAPTKGGE